MQTSALLNPGVNRDADFRVDRLCYARTIDYYLKGLYTNMDFTVLKESNFDMALMGETPHEWAARMGVSAVLLRDFEARFPYWQLFTHPFDRDGGPTSRLYKVLREAEKQQKLQSR